MASPKGKLSGLVCGGADNRNNVHPSAGFLELDFTVSQRKQGPIPANSDICSGMEFGTALPNDDRSGGNQLGAESLDTKSLGVAVPPV